MGWYIFLCVLLIVWAYFGEVGIILLGFTILIAAFYAILSNLHAAYKNKIEKRKAIKRKIYREENPIDAEYEDIVEGYRYFLTRFRIENKLIGIENIPRNRVENITNEIDSRKKNGERI